MNTEVEKFADYLIKWIISKHDREFDRITEFNIISMIVNCVELSYEDVLNIKKDAMMEFLRDMCILLSKDAMYSQAQIFEVADKLIRGSR